MHGWPCAPLVCSRCTVGLVPPWCALVARLALCPFVRIICCTCSVTAVLVQDLGGVFMLYSLALCVAFVCGHVCASCVRSLWLNSVVPVPTLCRNLLQCSPVSMFSYDEVKAVVGTVPQDKFVNADEGQRIIWIQYVANTDDKPKDKHPLFWYATVARVVAEHMGSVQSTDYSDPQMRDMFLAAVKSGDKPFDADTEAAEWRAVKLLPVQVAHGLKVLGRAQKDSQGTGAAAQSQSQLTTVMEDYVKAQQAALEKDKKKGTLSFDLAQRIKDVGLEGFPREAIPSEDALIKFEAAGKAASEKGRKYLGSVDGEDLQLHFRPSWSETLKIDVLLGDGSLEDKIKGALEARKARSTQDKVDYLGFANFQGHLMDWGLKMIILRVIDPMQLLAYQYLLVWVSEEWGGVRVSYHYDLLLRQEMAKALERGETDLSPYLTKLNRDMLGDAKRKVEIRAQEAGRDGARNLNNVPASGKGKKGKPGKDGKAWNQDASAAPRCRSPRQQSWQPQPPPPPPRPSWERASGKGASGSGKGKRWV